jgi:two-component system, OmpR family, sensor histidine kinase BaeS
LWTKIGLIRWADRSLTAKILVAFAAIVLVGIGSIAFLANQRTTDAFERYVRTGQPALPDHFADSIAALYRTTGSWDAVSLALDILPPDLARRCIIADPSGQVVVDTVGQTLGRPITSLGMTDGRPLISGGQNYGTLYETAPRRDRPPPQRPGFPGLLMPGQLVGLPPDQLFLAQVNQSILLAAVGATVVALILGILLARQIIRPLRQLTRGAQRIAEGHFGERINVGGHDEVSQLAHAFNQMAESLERTEEARRQLVADVAHELRTPLTIIGGTVQAMRDGVLPTDDQNLASIHGEVVALTRLVADLRDLSLSDVGQLPIVHEPVDPVEMLDPVVAAFTAEAGSRGISLKADLAPELPWILGDEKRLQQCIRNLVENALRHTPSGGSVTVRARQNAGGIEIAVIDTGEGIGADDLPRLFERFYRADPSRARRSGGTGLGLAIVQQIARAHGGDVTAASDGPGFGATFTLRLPVLTTDDVSTPETSRFAEQPLDCAQLVPSSRGRGLG